MRQDFVDVVKWLLMSKWLNSLTLTLSQALKELPRDKIQLATKFGIVKRESNNVIVKGDPEYVRACCETSLRRLGVDYIDLYYQHRVDATVPIEDTVSSIGLW